MKVIIPGQVLQLDERTTRNGQRKYAVVSLLSDLEPRVHSLLFWSFEQGKLLPKKGQRIYAVCRVRGENGKLFFTLLDWKPGEE